MYLCDHTHIMRVMVTSRWGMRYSSCVFDDILVSVCMCTFLSVGFTVVVVTFDSDLVAHLYAHNDGSLSFERRAFISSSFSKSFNDHLHTKIPHEFDLFSLIFFVFVFLFLLHICTIRVFGVTLI